MNVSEALSNEEIEELANVFGVSVAARHLLEGAGLSAGQIPHLPFGNAEDFWRQVSGRLAAGVLDFGRWRVLAEALKSYPHNRVFGAGVAAADRPHGFGSGPRRTTPAGMRAQRQEGGAVPYAGGSSPGGPSPGGASLDEAFPFTIVALDARSYSKQTLPTHLGWRGAIRDFVRSATDRCHIDPEFITVQDTGDGVLAGFGSDVSKRLIVAEFVGRLLDEVRSYNRGRAEAARIRLRASVHGGDTVVHDGGFAGDAAVVAARLVDAPPTRAVLEALPDVDLAVILSDQFYRDTVGQGLHGLDPRAYRREEVVIPKFTGVGWLNVPGMDLSVVPPTPAQPKDTPGGGSDSGGDGGPDGRSDRGSGGGPEGPPNGGSGRPPGEPRVPPPPGAVPPPGSAGRARESGARESGARESRARESREREGRAGGGRAGDDGTWDFLVSYAPTATADRRWAEWISWELEDAGYDVHIEAWDGLAGMSIAGRVDRAVIGSKRTIVVLTSDYVSSGRHEADWHTAWLADPRGTDRILIPVRVEEFTPPSGLLHGIVPLDLFGLAEHEARERLLQRIAQSLEGRAKPDVQPPFPGRARP
jgi:hypothetical protein